MDLKIDQKYKYTRLITLGTRVRFSRSCSLEKAPTTRKKDSRVEPQNRSGPGKLISIPFLR